MSISRRNVLLGGLGVTAAGLTAGIPLAAATNSKNDGEPGGGGGVTGSTWMASIDGRRSLASLTIPGTHDSCALHGGRYVACQTVGVAAQLAMGVRFLDIRVRNHRGGFPIHHGDFYQETDLGEVLRQCRDFLNQHPTETVLMSVKQEKSDTSGSEMAATWNRVTRPYRNMLSTGSAVPTLNAARGKVVVVSRSAGIPGIAWSAAHVCDNYSINTVSDWGRNKWPGVTKALDFAATKGSRSDLYVTFTSSWGTLLDPSRANAKMEPALKSWLDERPRRSGERLGVVVGDFAKHWKIEQIGARNFGRARWN
ncbi:phosphatidylinositol-specific phospholipase C [Mariniluteicoccus flavus]